MPTHCIYSSITHLEISFMLFSYKSAKYQMNLVVVDKLGNIKYSLKKFLNEHPQVRLGMSFSKSLYIKQLNQEKTLFSVITLLILNFEKFV